MMGNEVRSGKIGIVSLMLFLFVISSCDILRTSPFEVSGWSPGSGYHADPGAIFVSLTFSREPDRASVERHFSLAEDGNRIQGVFQWEGRGLIFLPAAPLEINRNYSLSISADAHDNAGLSMDVAFEGRFSTRPEGDRPVLLSFSPQNYALVNDSRSEVILAFSETMSLISLRDNVSFNPSMSGSWRLTENGKTAIFSPLDPWAYGKRYEIRLAASLAGSTGLAIGSDFLSVFTIGLDHEKPFLAEAWRVMKNGDTERLAADTSGTFIENSGWEREDRLRLIFSEAVDILSVKNCLTAENGPGLAMETIPGFYEEAVFCLETTPVFESRFAFRLKAGVKDTAGNESDSEYAFRIFANGKYSRPPEPVGIRLPMAPGNAANQEPISFGIDSLFANIPISEGTERYPSKTGIETWIECYFITASGAEVDPLSLMDLFRIDTSNNVLTFSPRQVKSNGFSAPDPQAGWEKYQRLEIRGILTNSTNFGVVNIQIGSGLRDTAGNRNEKSFCISLVK
ncbi:hypothetical protein AGMMS50293_08780 [Spirochaetia bacterium]|nr:hypothetical protein AGMMS50293_08780 [Spirochaetia bacterium]